MLHKPSLAAFMLQLACHLPSEHIASLKKSDQRKYAYFEACMKHPDAKGRDVQSLRIMVRVSSALAADAPIVLSLQSPIHNPLDVAANTTNPSVPVTA